MEREIYECLMEFADYLDNMESGKEKGKLSHFFVMFTHCYNKWLLDERLLKNIRGIKYV